MRAKYGTPREIDRGAPESASFFWKRSKDILVFANTPDMFGHPGYQIVIYYTGNLEELIRREELEKTADSKEKEEALKKAF